MKKYSVKIPSLILCLFLISTYFIPAYAVSDGTNDTLDQYIDYANSILPDLSRLPDTNFSMDNLYISQPIELLNDNDDTNYVFFLFDGSTCIGELVVSRIDGTFSASFLPGEMPLVSAAYADAAPICLVSAERALLLCTESTADVIAGDLTVASTSYSSSKQTETIISQAPKSTLNLAPVNFVSEVSGTPGGVPSTSKTLPVNFVANKKINGSWTCWAASSAAIINYLKNQNTLTAESIYKSVAENTPAPAGNLSNVAYAFTCYGINHYRSGVYNFSFDAVVRHINKGYPICALLESPQENHYVAICGYEATSDYNYYLQFMDSNVKTKVWVSVTNEHFDINLVYPAANGITYTGWIASVYSTLAA